MTFKGPSVARNCLIPESVPLKPFQHFFWREELHMNFLMKCLYATEIQSCFWKKKENFGRIKRGWVNIFRNFSDTEHQNIDWIGIHEKICQHLIALRTPVPFISGSEEERQHQQQQRITRQVHYIQQNLLCVLVKYTETSELQWHLF